MGNDEFFAPMFVQAQYPSHCGAASLSACMAMLGVSATQRQVADAAGSKWGVYSNGLDAYQLKRAAGHWKMRAEFLEAATKAGGARFIAKLRSHLKSGRPALLCVWEEEHWIAVLGYREATRQFIVMDPNDDDRQFSRWNERTLLSNAYSGDEADDAYFGILVRRRDERPPRWQLTDRFVRFCEVGAAATADEMRKDMEEMITDAKPPRGSRAKGGPRLLADVLLENEALLVDSVVHWLSSSARNANRAQLLHALRAYAAVAEAAALELPAGADVTRVLVPFAAILSALGAWGEL